MEPKEGWRYWEYNKLIAKKDLNGDNSPENLFVRAKVQKQPGQKNKWVWDDGHPWAVVVENATGKQTIIFLQWVQLSDVKPSLIKLNNGKTLIRLTIDQADEYDENNVVSKTSLVYDIIYRNPQQFSACQRVTPR